MALFREPSQGQARAGQRQGSGVSIRAKASERLPGPSLKPHTPTLAKAPGSVRAEWQCVSTGRAPCLLRPRNDPPHLPEATCLTDKKTRPRFPGRRLSSGCVANPPKVTQDSDPSILNAVVFLLIQFRAPGASQLPNLQTLSSQLSCSPPGFQRREAEYASEVHGPCSFKVFWNQREREL